VSALLPLFPLEVVLFPETAMPLHIFEPRYKEMIGECLSEQQPFGVVRAKENSLAEIGCSAEIIAVTKKYEDGNLDIVTEGRQRFRIERVDHERAFLQAEVVFFEDEAENTAVEREQVLQLYADIVQLLGGDPLEEEVERRQLSFHLAATLPLDLDFKQTLLGLRSETERITGLVEYFQAILPNLRRAVKARQKAGGNGHAG
jgi:Lon protease-like protein